MNITELKQLKLKFYKSGDKNKVSAINGVLSEVELIEARQNKNLTELELDSVIKKTISMFEEQTELAKNANRDSTEFSIKAEYLMTLLPQQLSNDEIEVAVKTTISSVGASTIKDMGKVMSHIKDCYGSSIDMKVVSSKVRELLK